MSPCTNLGVANKSITNFSFRPASINKITHINPPHWLLLLYLKAHNLPTFLLNMASLALKNITPSFLTAILGLVILIIINTLKLKSASFEAVFLTSINQNPDINALKYIVFIKISITLLTFSINIFIHWTTSQLYRQILKNILFEYLTLKHSSFTRIGVPAVQYLISLRSSSFCAFLEKLTIRILPRIVFLIIILYSTFGLLDSIVAGWLMGFFILLTATVCALQAARGYFRTHVNACYEESNTIRAQILESYERIHSYNTLEDELAAYFTCLQKYVLYKQIFNTLGHIIGFIFAISLLGITGYVWNSTNNTEQFGSIVLIYEDLKDSMHAVMIDTDQLIVEYVNFSYSKYRKNDREATFIIEQPVDFQSEIRASGLSVTLEGHHVLKNISFVAKKGEKIAITGLNGSGKSILISALTGNIEYDGSLQIDGVEVRDLSRKTISTLMSYVPQSGSIFNKSIQENLEVARDTIENIELVETCKAFNCHEIFKRIGYSKIVGSGGCLLSGGQRQRVILLGSILRGCKILVLDGPFKGLDQHAEDGFVDKLRGLKDNTLICCTQNIKLLKKFDSVLFVNGGICQKGTYDDLLDKNKEFRQYCKGNSANFSLLKVFGRAITKLKTS